MDSFKICAAAFLCTVTAVLVRQYQKDFALPLRTAASVLLLGFGLVLLTPALRWLSALCGETFPDETAEILMRALAVVFMVRICGGLCRDLGEPSIAAALEFAGKAELLLLAIPLLDRLLEAARKLAAW
ncbi:MAG: hypothetical protein IJC15_09200 [Clostridia bacterium]|nr:hypothetical protein [Clostridia bacterium]